MRRANWMPPAYLLAVMAVLAIFWAGHPAMARGAAIIPFLLLLTGITTGPRPRGWVCAAAGLACTALALGSFESRAGDTAGEAAIAVGTVALTAAMLRSGGWRAARRHRWLLGGFIAVAGFFAVQAAVYLAILMPALLNPPQGCVDTCWGPALGAVLSAILLGEVLLASLVAAALARHPLAGAGALVMAAGANALFFLAPPAPTPGYSAGIIAWFAGLFALLLPWLRLAPEVMTGLPEASGLAP